MATQFGFDLAAFPGLNSRPEHIKEVADASLKRLRTDVIDLLYQHRVDPSADLREIESALSEIKVHGARLCEEHMELIDR
ncbi:MAG TPA: aldo/keto reductase [Terrimicrobiaceae bacterium]